MKGGRVAALLILQDAERSVSDTGTGIASAQMDTASGKSLKMHLIFSTPGRCLRNDLITSGRKHKSRQRTAESFLTAGNIMQSVTTAVYSGRWIILPDNIESYSFAVISGGK